MQIHHQSVFEKWPIEDKSVQVLITSPPYYSLRKYSIPDVIIGGDKDCKHEWGAEQIIEKQHHGKVLATLKDNAKISSSSSSCIHCNAWQGQHGLEPTFKLYLEHTKLWMQEAIRVLRDDGVIFVNLGDSYNGSGGQGNQHKQAKVFGNFNPHRDKDYPLKSKLLIPERFAIMMADYDGEDIYELDKNIILCNNITITEDIANATQRQRKEKAIHEGVCEEISEDTQIQGISERMDKPESREIKTVSTEILLGKQRKGNNEMYQGECKEAQEASDGGIDLLWRESSKMSMLQRTSDSILDDRPYQRGGKETQVGNKAIWFDIRMAQAGKISSRLQNFMYELQFGSRTLWFLPPSRGKGLRIRKDSIPVDLVQYFNLIEEKRLLVRNHIVWYKPNGMPESCQDRFSKKWESIFMFVKQPKYYFNLDDVREPHKDISIARLDRAISNKELARDEAEIDTQSTGGQVSGKLYKDRIGSMQSTEFQGGDYLVGKLNPLGKNPGDVWNIPTQPSPEKHFAMWPEKLVERMILCSTKAGDVVFDPFCGSGTTGRVAIQHNRNFIGIDLGYEDIQQRRTKNIQRELEVR